jgi:hypothetical protein
LPESAEVAGVIIEAPVVLLDRVDGAELEAGFLVIPLIYPK